MKNPVVWFETYVADMTRAKYFYENVFNLKLSKMESGPELDMWAFPSDDQTYGVNGALVSIKGMKPHGISTIVYFRSEDCSIEEKRVIQFGGKIDRPKMSIGKYGYITLAVDTEGNMFGIHSMK